MKESLQEEEGGADDGRERPLHDEVGSMAWNNGGLKLNV